MQKQNSRRQSWKQSSRAASEISCVKQDPGDPNPN